MDEITDQDVAEADKLYREWVTAIAHDPANLRELTDKFYVAHKQYGIVRDRLDAVPVDALHKLRAHLSTDGDYSIRRTDGEPMWIGETIMLGSVFEAIDKWLDAPQAMQP